jgi:hypothetical protein
LKAKVASKVLNSGVTSEYDIVNSFNPVKRQSVKIDEYIALPSASNILIGTSTVYGFVVENE